MSDEQPIEMAETGSLLPRRAFIRKSLMLSGAAFVGTSSVDRIRAPELSAKGMPMRAASVDGPLARIRGGGDEDDSSGGGDNNGNGRGRNN